MLNSRVQVNNVWRTLFRVKMSCEPLYVQTTQHCNLIKATCTKLNHEPARMSSCQFPPFPDISHMLVCCHSWCLARSQLWLLHLNSHLHSTTRLLQPFQKNKLKCTDVYGKHVESTTGVQQGVW